LSSPLSEAQIFEPVDADLHTQEGAELFVHPHHEALAVDPQDMMPVVEFFQHAVQLAAQSLVLAHPEDLGDGVGGEAKTRLIRTSVRRSDGSGNGAEK
jgi:hypothetical protein